jgi:hypothetical protein
MEKGAKGENEGSAILTFSFRCYSRSSSPPDSKDNVRSDETNFVQGLNKVASTQATNYDWSTIMERIKNWREDFDSAEAEILTSLLLLQAN